MTLTILQLFAFQLVLPAILLYSLWKGPYSSKLDWVIQVLATGMFMMWIILTGRWDWVSYYLRFVWLLLFVLTIYKSWKKASALPFWVKFNRKQKWSVGVHVFLILIFGMYNVFAFSGYTTEDQAIELSFPLKNGVYYVGQGGNHVQINYHNAYPKQKFALDIVELNKFGVRAAGIYPKQLENYVIYGDQLYSPCTGKVLKSREHLPDLIPPNANPDRPKGNFVKINCEDMDANVYIAHTQEGSVVVKEGNRVQTGQPIGLVGNSGNTTEPHLHIHAQKNGVGVPIRFDGRFLVRNSLVW